MITSPLTYLFELYVCFGSMYFSVICLVLRSPDEVELFVFAQFHLQALNELEESEEEHSKEETPAAAIADPRPR